MRLWYTKTILGRLPRIIINTKSFSNSPSHPELIVERTKSGKKVLTLNRPKRLNALSVDMVRRMRNELETENSRSVPYNLVIVQGAGEKAFSAGGDVAAASMSYKAKTGDYRDFFHTQYQLEYLIGKLKVPFVALIDGITMGAGCGLSVHGQFRVATERTIMAMPETALGFFPDAGATYFFPRLSGKLGLFLGLTGYRLSGADAFHSGLATHYVESKNLGALTQALLKLPWEKCDKENVDKLLKAFQSHRIPASSVQPLINEINHYFNAPNLEGIFKNLEAGQTEFSMKTLSVLRKMSPTSLKIFFRQYKLGSTMEFADVFPVEFRLSQRLLQENDFHEGCRAILIDKDRNPKWSLSCIEEITEEKIDWYFSPFDNSKEELILH
ncbi:enoyl-CoA hydratase/isomerase domain-containing protein [Ditylenchus destructor]|uniref:3-hydroxyisobutyryl-CoA hydrolase, mitochondrial n=1 Tax=Ditylenchus destructor TaxID=166010 RepID=A0AAD4NAC6_9BILA|nr:enoyl-CoA hydratase/isomerase domain-containing protein [Ditylenchus destructor]